MANKLTIVKVLPHGEDCSPTQEDLERWHKLFQEKKVTLEEAAQAGDIEYEVLPEKEEGEYYLTVVKIGGENYMPTFEDLEQWRKVFEEAKDDPDFKIFTHPEVEVNVINVGKIIATELDFDHPVFVRGKP